MKKICKSIQQCMLNCVSWFGGKSRTNSTSCEAGLLREPVKPAGDAERKNIEPLAGKKYGR